MNSRISSKALRKLAKFLRQRAEELRALADEADQDARKFERQADEADEADENPVDSRISLGFSRISSTPPPNRCTTSERKLLLPLKDGS